MSIIAFITFLDHNRGQIAIGLKFGNKKNEDCGYWFIELLSRARRVILSSADDGYFYNPTWPKITPPFVSTSLRDLQSVILDRQDLDIQIMITFIVIVICILICEILYGTISKINQKIQNDLEVREQIDLKSKQNLAALAALQRNPSYEEAKKKAEISIQKLRNMGVDIDIE